MIVLYRNAPCPLCGAQHDLWLDQAAAGLTYRPHEYLCPTAGRRVAWSPNVFARLAKRAPNESVELTPWHAEDIPASRDGFQIQVGGHRGAGEGAR